jgi:hypothetical protein
MLAEMLPGTTAAPLFAAHLFMENIGKGMPQFRIEDTFARAGIPVDCGTQSRWKKRVGDGLAVVVKAMQPDAFATASASLLTLTASACRQLTAATRAGIPARRAIFSSRSRIRTAASSSTSR